MHDRSDDQPVEPSSAMAASGKHVRPLPAPAGALPTPGVNETKKSRAVVKPAANFQIKDGLNVVCFASHRKTAVAISPMCGDRGHELPHR
jgi:hypothetical protein